MSKVVKTNVKNVLEIRGLKTYFHLDEGTLKAVDGVDLTIREKSIVGVIGESGSGKSVTARSVLRIIPNPGEIVAGEILLHPKEGKPVDLVKLDAKGSSIRKIRGKVISMIFQEPMTSLSPVHTVGNQIMEAIFLHRTSNRREAREIALDMIEKVGISNPKQRIDEYPHQMSGGMRQRAMIAMALSCNPDLLIADEPTTALDVTVQAQILELLKDLQEQFNMAVMYITHNLGVVAEIADEVNVMYLGRVVETAKTREIFKNPQHPYTRRLLQSIPKVGKKAGSRLEAIRGNVPVPINPPRQCGFYSRCEEVIEGRCNVAIPALVKPEKPSVPVKESHKARCFLVSEAEESKEVAHV